MSNCINFLKKYGWILLLLILVVVVVTMQVIPKVDAAVVSDEEWIDKWQNFLKGFGVTIFDKMVEGYGTLTEFANPASGNGDAAAGVQAIVKFLAHFFVVIFAFIGIVKEGTRGDIDVDMIYWFRIFANTAVAIVMVTCITTIMSSLYGLGDFVVSEIAEGQTEAVETDIMQNGKIDFTEPGNEEKLVATLKNIPGFENIGVVREANGRGENGENYLPQQNLTGYLDIFMYVAYLPMLVALFLMYSAIFELKIRQILAPMAVATIAYEGARGAGVRFLKKYLACFLKIAIYFLVAWIGYCLSMYFYQQIINTPVDVSSLGDKGESDITAPGVMSAVMMLLSNVVCAMAMMQTGGIADEVVGA